MKHNTPGITLEQFIALKPRELRLGQFFVNTYCKPVKNHWEGWVHEMYEADGAKAKRMITQLMVQWQWDTLPEIGDEK
jgi:hypothetical protein